MKAILGIALSLCVFSSVHAQASDEPIVINRTCDPKSGVTIDNGEPTRFACDSAVIARTERGTVLIQFTDKSGDDGRILGFAGTIEGKQGFGADLVQMIAVERIYLTSGGNPIPASAGTCIMNWARLQRTSGRLTSILCGGRGQVEGSDIRAMAVLQAQ